MSRRQARGTAVTGLLCPILAGWVLAGCASVAASAPAAAPASSSAGPSSSGASSAGAVGCAAVDQATSVTVHRTMRLVEPTRAGVLVVTQSNATVVQALFGQFCRAVQHAATTQGTVHCPADYGISYTGTFYGGSRTLARFVYGASGCQTLSITADGKTQSTMVLGTASAAAPRLRTDMAAVLGVPEWAVGQPQSRVNPSGANKPLR